MKKLILLSLTLMALVIGLTACNNDDNSTASNVTSNNTISSQMQNEQSSSPLAGLESTVSSAVSAVESRI